LRGVRTSPRKMHMLDLDNDTSLRTSYHKTHRIMDYFDKLTLRILGGCFLILALVLVDAYWGGSRTEPMRVIDRQYEAGGVFISVPHGQTQPITTYKNSEMVLICRDSQHKFHEISVSPEVFYSKDTVVQVELTLGLFTGYVHSKKVQR